MPAKKKKKEPAISKREVSGGHIEGGGITVVQPITDTLRENYMPYAMSVIISRAIPEIDGFKPSHRKILYTMYKMGLLSGGRIKSANVVGQTMRLNPHGEGAIYETMVRLSRGYDALIVPYIDSKGNFGKSYSRDMAFAASRYTEVKLEKVCSQLFSNIDKDTVDFVDNYDSTMKEPSLLPVTFPTILVNANTGIAVGMASNIPSFNLAEVCKTTAAFIRNPNHKISDTLLAPDFSGGGRIIYNEEELEKIYKTGKGSLKVRSYYTYDKDSHCIDITEIPPSTTVEAIIDKTLELIKQGKIREISDMRDETDLSGLKLTIDIKRGVDPDKLMSKLFKMTPLEDSFSCNFNVLIAGSPHVMGISEILEEWVAFRRDCVRRGIFFDLTKSKEKLHLLKGLQKILLDIDKAVRIVRETEEENEVIPNLMIGFGIDQTQAEFVAEIKLRHLNREYILRRTEDIEKLKNDIAGMEETLSSPKKLDAMIIAQLDAAAKEFGSPRRTQILYSASEEVTEPEEEVASYPVKLFFTAEGYFKKINLNSLRMSGEHKLKEGDSIVQTVDSDNTEELLFFTNKGQVYKSRVSDFEDSKASVLGEYIAGRLSMEPGEQPIFMALTPDYKGYMLFVFENGKASKIDLSSYETKQKRKKLMGAFSTKSPIVFMDCLREDREYLLCSSASRMLIVNTAMIPSKSARDAQGVQVMTLKKSVRVISGRRYEEGTVENPHRLKTKNLPAAGAIVREAPLGVGEQMLL